ncbi:MAG: flagellar hook-length control protein FliK [Zoogloeaceae bacterium]|jgi:flagellar hook-length control protein FliK|nr:flagellar hook-length control protein FliK [Zoogloeaceae bacterium]
MTISLVSAAASGGNPLAAITGDAAASGDTGDIFSILFSRLLAGTPEDLGVDTLDFDLSAALEQLQAWLDASDATLDPNVSAALTQLQTQLKSQLEAQADASLLNPAAFTELASVDAAALQQLPEEIQSLLRDLKKRLAQEEDKADTQISLLGALSTPIELPQEMISGLANSGGMGGMDGSRADADPRGTMRLTQHLAGLEKAVAELLPSKSANLAAGTEKSTDDFSQLLRSNLLQGQAQNQGVSAPVANVGGQGLQTPVMSPAWAQEFGEKIVWMAKSGQQTAQLSLNPAHLGPLTINLNLDADKASATFTATTAEVRQAIEEAMPRLREMLAAAGVALGETSVGTQTRQEWQTAQQQAAQQQDAGNAARRNARATRGNGDGAILEDHLPVARAVRAQHGVGMVDLFA